MKTSGPSLEGTIFADGLAGTSCRAVRSSSCQSSRLHRGGGAKGQRVAEAFEALVGGDEGRHHAVIGELERHGSGAQDPEHYRA